MNVYKYIRACVLNEMIFGDVFSGRCLHDYGH